MTPGERELALRRRIDALSATQRAALAEALAPEMRATERLVAFVVADGAATPSGDSMRAFLAERLSEFMIPAQFVVVDALPRTVAGKLDRAALAREAPTNERETQRPPAPVAEITELESQLIAIWRDVLKTEQINVADDFFEIGGDSLLSIRVISRAARAGIRIPPELFFERPTIRHIAASLSGGGARKDGGHGQLPRRGSLVSISSLGNRPPLYAVPGIAGSVLGFTGLARHLGPEQPFGAFESPGLDGREPPLSSIEAIAERYVEELAPRVTGPYHLLGICWGAAVAFEMARRLHDLGRAPTSVALLDPATLLRDTTPRPPRAELRFVRERLELYWDEFRHGNWAERSRMLANKAKRAAHVLTPREGEAREQSHSELLRLRVREANELAVTRFVPQPLVGRAILFVTTTVAFETERDPRLEWLSLIAPTPAVTPVDGENSGDVLGPKQVERFARALEEWMAFAAAQT